jgi:hypothetical protein
MCWGFRSRSICSVLVGQTIGVRRLTSALTRTVLGAHVPDLPGSVATGRSMAEIKKRMAKAIEMHLAAMREDGDPRAIPR